MEAAFDEGHQREYEITRKVLLSALDGGVHLNELKRGGSCFFSLPASLFDADYPNHPQRRFKQVNLGVTFAFSVDSVAMPSVVNATLTLQGPGTSSAGASNVITHSSLSRLPQSMVTGTLQAVDPSTREATFSGVFITNYLNDTRYFPFEGEDEVSDW